MRNNNDGKTVIGSFVAADQKRETARKIETGVCCDLRLFDGGGPCRLHQRRPPDRWANFGSADRCSASTGFPSGHNISLVVFQHRSRNRSIGNNVRRRKGSGFRTARVNHPAHTIWLWGRIGSQWLRAWRRWTGRWTFVNFDQSKDTRFGIESLSQFANICHRMFNWRIQYDYTSSENKI